MQHDFPVTTVNPLTNIAHEYFLALRDLECYYRTTKILFLAEFFSVLTLCAEELRFGESSHHFLNSKSRPLGLI